MMRTRQFQQRRSFRADARGNVAVMFAIAVPAAIGIVAAAVDYTRSNNFGARMQGAVDQASLAATAAARNGLDSGTVTTIAQNVFSATLSGQGVTASPPQVQVQKMGTQNTVTVSAQGTYSTIMAQFLGSNSVALNRSATAMALTGPTGGAAMAQNSNGSGNIWGDPHVSFTSSSGGSASKTITCNGNSWYSLLSDSAIQWNSLCRNDGSGLFFINTNVMAGTHTVSVIPQALPNTTGWTSDDSFSDDIVINGTGANGSTGRAWPSTLVIDGKTIDPTSPQYAGLTSFTVVNDGAQKVTISIQMSNHPIPSTLTPTVATQFNFLAVDIKTAQYELSLTMDKGYQSSDLTVTNGGMCGPVGGFFGAWINGAATADPSPYVITDPNFKGAQFGWTPTCNNSGGQIARLIQ